MLLNKVLVIPQFPGGQLMTNRVERCVLFGTVKVSRVYHSLGNTWLIGSWTDIASISFYFLFYSKID